MERGKFKKILPKHFKTCRKLIEARGSCKNAKVDCKDCPFSSRNNAVTGWGCWVVGHCDILAQEKGSDEKLVQSCEEFIKEFEVKK